MGAGRSRIAQNDGTGCGNIFHWRISFWELLRFDYVSTLGVAEKGVTFSRGESQSATRFVQSRLQMYAKIRSKTQGLWV